MEWAAENITLIWFILGCLLIISEIVFSTAVLLFLGLGTLAAALASWLGLSFEWQLAVFMVASVITFILFRKKLKNWLTKADRKVASNFVGETAQALTPLEPGLPGKALLNGVEWKALTNLPVKQGDYVWIKEQQGLTLIVEPKGVTENG